MNRTLSFLLCLLCFGLFASSCSPVKPWQKGILAKETMQFDPDPLESRFRRHVYASKEGSEGGYGGGIGGCGCN